MVTHHRKSLRTFFGLALLITLGFFTINEIKCTHSKTDITFIASFKNPRDVLKIVAQILPTNPIIIEAGSYNGADTEYLAKYWKNGSVHSFEPIPALYKKTTQRVKKCKNVSTYQVALSNKNGSADFYISSLNASPNAPSASSSLLEPALHLVHAPQVGFKKKIVVQTMTLDLWAEKNKIRNVDFIWLDTQGSELSILKNSSKILPTVKAILLEVIFIEAYKNQPSFDETKTWMESQGFQLAALSKTHVWYGDALFIRHPKA